MISCPVSFGRHFARRRHLQLRRRRRRRRFGRSFRPRLQHRDANYFLLILVSRLERATDQGDSMSQST